MFQFKYDSLALAAPFFVNSSDTFIRSALQGVMGEVWADAPENPRCARIDLGDFSFLGGDPTAPAALNLIKGARTIVASCGAGWEEVIAKTLPDARASFRRATLKEDYFDRKALQGFAGQLPEGFILAPIDEKAYHYCLSLSWARDFCALFDSWQDFSEKGLGWLIWKDNGELVAGASSYSAYREGIEIQIETREDNRRQGLALCCGAKLILDCLERGIYPSWDAANPASATLAEKLGYRLGELYPVWMKETMGDDDF